MKSGDKVRWSTEHPSYKSLVADFGEGPFTVLGVEEGAPEDGRWISLLNAEGLAWVDHNRKWESPKADQPGLHKAIPPTFHSQWLVLENP